MSFALVYGFIELGNSLGSLFRLSWSEAIGRKERGWLRQTLRLSRSSCEAQVALSIRAWGI